MPDGPAYRVVVLASGGGSNLQSLIDAVHARGEAEIVLVVGSREGIPALDRAARALAEQAGGIAGKHGAPLRFADAFPIRHFFEAFFSAWDPSSTGGGLEPGQLAIVLGWGVAALAAALLTFRWEPRR